VTSEFVHLHVHSQYSLLDSTLRIKDLAARAKALGMRAVALTDHGNMFGAIQHYKACKEQGLGAILGCEVNVVRRWGSGSEKDAPADHLVLIATSAEGYKNLVRIVSRGHVDPASGVGPSVTLETIGEHRAGIVALSGCMGGVVAQRILEHGEQEGRAELDRLRSFLEPGSLYVELQDHGLVEQGVLNGILARAAKDMGLPLVATNDAHFGARDDGESQLYLSCIAANRSFADALEAHHGSYEMFLKSGDEMVHQFRDFPEARRATLEIAERCAGLKLTLGKPMLPTFNLPAGFDTDSYFRHEARKGLDVRFAEAAERGAPVIDVDGYKQRLETELDVIIQMGFPGYFLIVWDFIRHAKEKGIPVGPGRGSGAGSLVAFALRITDLDPIPYGLLFERFLNPERVSMPDFDVDFCMDRRDEVIAYVGDRYGKTSVGQIATFHELKARSVIKDVARAMGMPANEAQKIASLIPQKSPGVMFTIPEALDVEPKLKALKESDPTVGELLTQGQKLEGLTRHAGMHAAGVVISEGPLWDHVPCFKNGEMIVTQYYKDDVELAGLVKFDFLGLKTLTVIDIAVRLINARPDHTGRIGAPRRFDVAKIAMDDQATFDLLKSGDTTGVFQLESSGMQQLFKDLKPDVFEDIVAAVALYRPGPLGTGMVKDFIECKHGRKPIEKMHALVDELLKPTYGVIVYQEQVMQIAQRLAGYTLGGADLLRRAMGKKKPEEMAKQKATFVDGALGKGVAKEDAERIFGLLEYFAGYGFNKSHSAAYALLTYQTAYLKAHFPVEFLCALMTADRDKIDKVVRIIAEGRAWGVEILPPEINQSKTDFTVVYEEAAAAGANGKKANGARRGSGRVRDPLRPKIRFGLGAIRGVGETALEAVLEARKEGGAFADLFDFAERVDAKRVNKGVLEALVQCGAFDATLAPRGITRARAFAAIDRALERSRRASRDREGGQTDLFGLFKKAAPKGEERRFDDYPACEDWDSHETLKREKQSLGFYVSGHPLDRYGVDLSRLNVVPTSALAGMDPWSKVRVGGMVEDYRERIFKGGGGKIAFFILEDATGRVEVKVRQQQIEQFAHYLNGSDPVPVLIMGKVSFPMTEEGSEEADAAPRDPTLLLDEVTPLAEAIMRETRSVSIRVNAKRAKREHISQLGDVLRASASPGGCPVQLVIQLDDGSEAVLALGKDLRVEPSDRMLARLEKLFGEKVAELR
jgi:DNA polymerase-3 subunit alpha